MRCVLSGVNVIASHRNIKSITRKSGNVEHLGELISRNSPLSIARRSCAWRTSRRLDRIRIDDTEIRSIYGVKSDLRLIFAVRLDGEPPVAFGLTRMYFLSAAFGIGESENKGVAAEIVAKNILELLPRVLAN